MAEQEIEACVSSEGYHLTWRFSPGYGDLPLDTQKELVQVLDMHRKDRYNHALRHGETAKCEAGA